jgi:hypothetical protein
MARSESEGLYHFVQSGLKAGAFFPAFLCLAGVAFNHSVFRLGGMSHVWAVLLLLAVAFVAVAAPQVRIGAENRSSRRPPLGAVALGILFLAPLLASLILGWNRDYPFSGDTSFHLKQAAYMLFWWISPGGSAPLAILGRELDPEAARSLLLKPASLLVSRAFVLAVGAVIVASIYRRNRAVSLVAGALALTVWGLFESAIYFRYPGGWYILAMPFIGVGYLLGNIEIGGRITNVLAAISWLFVLRPWIVGRWPDIPVTLLCALVLWQKDSLFYFDSAYTEPWAVVFALLAIEVIVRRGREGVGVACLLVGVAATFKEPYVLALPFIWLMGRPWKAPLTETLTNTGCAVAGGFPFVFYYAARKSVDLRDLVTDRTIEFGLDQVPLHFQGMFSRLSFDYSGTGALLAVAALVSLAALLPFVKSSDRWLLILSSAAALFIIIVFAVDFTSLTWAGYFRFFLYPLPFLAAGLIVFGHRFDRRLVAAVGALAILLQIPSAYLAVARSAGPATDRNFTEHYDAPIVFPLKPLLAQAYAQGLLTKGQRVLANQPDLSVKPVPGIPVDFGAPGEMYCECTSERPNVLALFVRYSNLNASHVDRPPREDEVFALRIERDVVWRAMRSQRPACVAQILKTCGRVIERSEGGEIVAALGVR